MKEIINLLKMKNSFGTKYLRNLHHSAYNGKYYTNRLYMKRCCKCLSWNNLSMINCTTCSNNLTDADIRLRVQDPFCKIANARKYEGNDSRVLYKCFDYSIIQHPQPCSFIHISASPNGTFYDIKNFRKSHTSLILEMKNKCQNVIKDLLMNGNHTTSSTPDTIEQSKGGKSLQENASVTGNINVSNYGQIIDSLRDSMIKGGWQGIASSIIYGFKYPNNFTHVDMNVILPPIYSFNLFKAPFYYPLDKVIGDLNTYGQVKNYTSAEVRRSNETDETHHNIVKIDDSFRSSFVINK